MFSKLAIIGLDNGLSPVQYQAIFWPNADLLTIWPTKEQSWIKIKMHVIFIEENEFENVACKMVAILFRPQWVNPTCAEFLRGT